VSAPGVKGQKERESFSSFDQRRRRQIVTLHCLSLALGERKNPESIETFSPFLGPAAAAHPFLAV